MNITGVFVAASVVGLMGLMIGILLGVASEKFKLEVDEREILVREVLPGYNCGGCGYPGCDELAKAIVLGQAEVTACPVGKDIVAKQIAAIISEAIHVENN